MDRIKGEFSEVPGAPASGSAPLSAEHLLPVDLSSVVASLLLLVRPYGAPRLSNWSLSRWVCQGKKCSDSSYIGGAICPAVEDLLSPGIYWLER